MINPIKRSIVEGDPVVEALLTLIKDLNAIMEQDWQDRPEVHTRQEINRAIKRSLEIAI